MSRCCNRGSGRGARILLLGGLCAGMLLAADEPATTGARELFRQALTAYKQQNYKLSLKLLRTMQDEYPSSPYSVRGLEYIAQCENQLGDPYAAFESYQKIWDEHKDFPRLPVITRNQMMIGNYYLNAERYKQAIEIYQKILLNAPQSDVAAAAQYSLAKAYIGDKDFDAAKLELEKVMKNYPNSQLVDDAAFELGYVDYQQAQAAPHDQQPAITAIASFRRFVSNFPSSPRVPEAQQYIRELRGQRASALFRVGEFYENIRAPKSAQITFREVIEQYPDTSYADAARARLASMGATGAAYTAGDQLQAQALRQDAAKARAVEAEQRVAPPVGTTVAPAGATRAAATAAVDAQQRVISAQRIAHLQQNPVLRTQLREQMKEKYAQEMKASRAARAAWQERRVTMLDQTRRRADEHLSSQKAASVPARSTSAAAARSTSAPAPAPPAAPREVSIEDVLSSEASVPPMQPPLRQASVSAPAQVSAPPAAPREVSIEDVLGSQTSVPPMQPPLRQASVPASAQPTVAGGIAPAATPAPPATSRDVPPEDVVSSQASVPPLQPPLRQASVSASAQPAVADTAPAAPRTSTPVAGLSLSDTTPSPALEADQASASVATAARTSTAAKPSEAEQLLQDMGFSAPVTVAATQPSPSAAVAGAPAPVVPQRPRQTTELAMAGAPPSPEEPLVSGAATDAAGTSRRTTELLDERRVEEQTQAAATRQQVEAARLHADEGRAALRQLSVDGRVRRATLDESVKTSQTSTVYNTDALQREYAGIYGLIMRGDLLMEEGVASEAKKFYSEALTRLLALREKAPDWQNTDIVDMRIEYCRTQLRSVQ